MVAILTSFPAGILLTYPPVESYKDYNVQMLASSFNKDNYTVHSQRVLDGRGHF